MNTLSFFAFMGFAHQWEINFISILIIFLREDITTIDLEDSAEDFQLFTILYYSKNIKNINIFVWSKYYYFDILRIYVILLIGLPRLIQ